MSLTDYKRLVSVLAALVVLLLVLCAWLFWERFVLHIRVAFADDQMEIFEEMRDRALRSEAAEAVGYLEYAVAYYPSGTKQEAGSRLDGIVERYRALVVRDIIAHLRARTDQDLGDDPQAWIDKFARK